MVTDTIREFLVRLGFSSDEAALKKFEEGIGKATKAVVTLAAAVQATALTVAIGVGKFAANLEQLYWASQRTGTSVLNLKAMEVAAQNFGASAEDALSSVEGLARFLRTNPGGEGLLQSLGLQTRDPKTGRLRDTSDLLVDLGKAFAKMPTYLATQYSGMFGISDTMMLALRNGDFARELARIREEVKNSGLDKAAEDAKNFEKSLRDLMIYIEAFGLKVQDALQNKLGISVKGVTDWLEKNGPWLADVVVNAAKRVVDAAEWIIEKIEVVVAKLREWDRATDGWSTRILGFAVALKFLGGAEVIGGVLRLAAAFVTLGAGIKGSIGLAASFGVGLGWLIDHFFPNNPLARFGNFIGGVGSERDERIPNAVRAFTSMGWSSAAAAGIVAHLEAESGLEPFARGDHGQALGIGQWHKPLQDLFAKWAGHPLQQSNLAEQESFLNWDFRQGPDKGIGAQLMAQRNADQVARIMSLQYERPAAGTAEADRRAAAATQISLETNIHVDGSGDPKAVADEVANLQKGVHADLVRNLSAPTQ